VIDVENELKELLRARAEKAGTDPTIAPTLVRRARSRRQRTVAVTAVFTVAVVLGSVVGVRAILDFEPPREVAAGPEWRGLWPQATRDKAVDAQDEVDRLLENGACVSTEIESCNHALAWQLDGVEVATRYAVDVLQWDRPFIEEGFEVSGAADPGPVLLHVGTCKAFASDACGYEARITVERLIHPGRGGLWFVTGVALSASVERAEAMVRAFLQSRVAGSGADMYLSPVAKGTYEDHVEGISLYGDFTGFRILEAIIVREGVYRFEILLEGTSSEPGEEPRSRFENLSVGAGEALDGTQRAALILSVTVPSDADSSGSSPQPGTDDEAGEPGFLAQAKDLVAAFMDARIGGSGAVMYLTPYAHGQYMDNEAAVSADEPGLYLYGNPHPQADVNFSYDAWRFEGAVAGPIASDDAQAACAPGAEDECKDVREGVIHVSAEAACAEFTRADCNGVWQIVVELEVTYAGEGTGGTFQETLFVGPDENEAAEIRAAIRGDVLVDDNP
jgi:hypothetical protein